MIKFPKKLKKMHDGILRDFSEIVGNWQATDEINEIRVGHQLDKKILEFLIELTNYMIINYHKVNIKLWSEFVSTFPLKFNYGKNVDDFNYIYDDELGDIFLTKLNDFEKIISIKKLNLLNKQFKKLRKELD